ncbi:site-specific integrase [Pleionea sediminis]|uniref:site-specific integrase n=1 Tax=Pleionea sediminis TaxID=2569479 RepID=UPI0011870FEF|nr:site-specific integrase [Pleionea sediminis]
MDRGYRGVTARGSTIQISFTFKGVQCRESLKLKPTKANLLYAARKREAIIFEIASNKFKFSEHFPNSRSKAAKYFGTEHNSQTTIEMALKAWVKTMQKKVQKSTLKDYNSIIYHHLIPYFGHCKLYELTTQMVEDWISDLQLSNKRINNILVPLKAIYKKAINQKVIPENPMKHIRNLPVQTREPQPFTPNEINRILNELEGQVKNYIQFAIWTGLRTSELLALKWEDIDYEQGVIHVKRAKVLGQEKSTKTKTGNRKVKLLSGACDALLNQERFTRNICDYIFHDPRHGRPWKNDEAIRKVFWYPALERAGIEKRNVYQTRHTYASLALSAGENLMWVSKQMGHDKPSTTLKSYARWISSMDSNAGSKLTKKIS